MSDLPLIDWLVIIGYFALTLGVAWWVSRKASQSSADYFLASRDSGWFLIGASLFASNIGAEHLVGLAGAGAGSGFAVAHYEIWASMILLLLGWLFVPFYLRSGVYTMPEFLERRYGPSARWYLAVISIIAYVLTKISVTIVAGALVFETLFGGGFWVGAIAIVALTGAYTVLGGLKAVLYTDMLQMFVFIAGGLAVTVVGLNALGGWDALRTTVGSEYFNIWKPSNHSSYPWTGIVFGAPLLGIWYWCTDQFIVQRVLSAPDVRNARLGCIFAGYLKLLPMFLFVLPGVIAAALAAQGKLTLSRADAALPTLMTSLLPDGLRGLVLAGLLAALMSSLSSMFNSCSTLLTWDIYRKLRPQASERQLVWFGQIATGFLVLCGFAWIPFMKNISEQLFQYLQAVQAYIAPPIAAVFLLGVMWPRANTAGAMTALLTGVVLGAARLVMEFNKDALTGPLHTYATMNFLHFAIAMFVVCTALLILVSLATTPPSREQIAGLTFNSDAGRAAQVVEAGAHGPSVVLGSLGVVAGVVAIWLLFRG